MPVVAQYGSQSFTNVCGYRISMQMVPGQGFLGRFYVYIYEVVAADAHLPRAHVKTGEEGKVPRDNLKITGENRDYEFPLIDLISVVSGVTRSERYRMLEFRYDPEITDRGTKPNIKLDNNDPTVIMKGGLQDDHMYKIEDSAEHCLGFATRQTQKDDVIYRIAGARNKNNSWVKKINDLNDKQMTESSKLMPEWKATMGGTEFNIKRENLRMVLVDESYGQLLFYPIPTLAQVASRDIRQDYARTQMHNYTPWELCEHDEKGDAIPDVGKNRTLETVTIVFQQGHYDNVALK